jgi:large conductance mechanosensitive channel
MLQQFKEFALKGNVVDLAIGVVIGAAFGKIVDSMVGDLLMPIIGWITGGLDFSNYFLALGKNVTAIAYEEAKKQGAVIGFGQFITIAVNFIIIAWVLFMVVKAMNTLKRSEAAAAPPPAPAADVVLLGEIRDLLASQKK